MAIIQDLAELRGGGIKSGTPLRDVDALLEHEEAHLYWALFSEKNWGGPKYFLP